MTLHYHARRCTHALDPAQNMQPPLLLLLNMKMIGSARVHLLQMRRRAQRQRLASHPHSHHSGCSSDSHGYHHDASSMKGQCHAGCGIGLRRSAAGTSQRAHALCSHACCNPGHQKHSSRSQQSQRVCARVV